MMRCDLCIHEKVCDAWRHHKDGAMCENFVNKNDAAPVKHGHWIGNILARPYRGDRIYPNGRRQGRQE